jgi:hypothetical protein
VPEAGVSGLVIALNHPASVRGRVQYVGAAPPPAPETLNRATAVLQPVAVLPAGTVVLAVSPIAPDSTFRIDTVLPGKYAVGAIAMPGFPTLKSVTAAGADITDLPLDAGVRDVSDLVVTMTDTPLASLAVNMPDAVRSEETDRHRVLVFPADQKYWAVPAAATRRFRTLTLSIKGTATAPGLPGGEYLVVVATPEEAADWMDAGRLEPLSRRAQRVTLNDGGERSIEVRK